MEDKEAIEILIGLMKKNSFSEKEKEAILSAIGILSWTKLGQSRIRNIAKVQKAKRAKMLEGIEGQFNINVHNKIKN